jgi:hypothetical protein
MFLAVAHRQSQTTAEIQSAKASGAGSCPHRNRSSHLKGAGK